MSDTVTASSNEPRSALDEARAGIDTIDDKIHDLLMERSQLVRYIGSAKKGGGGAYRPAREAQILHRLAQRHQQPLDFAIVYRLWRELIGGFTAMQAPLHVSVLDGTGLEKLARDHFGAAAEINAYNDNEALKNALRADPSLIAIIPADGWRICLDAGAPKIVSALPVYGDRIDAFCVASVDPQDSGDDMTLFAVNAPAPASSNLVCLDKTDTDCLVAASGFLPSDEARMAALASECGVPRDAVRCVGGYPVPVHRIET